jgi:hypothetical protein
MIPLILLKFGLMLQNSKANTKGSIRQGNFMTIVYLII